MDKTCFAMGSAEVRAFLERVPFVQIAGTGPHGPILRTVHGVLLDDAVYFHAGDFGEKLELLGRPVVLAAQEVVAELPSWFFDARRACPATTYYRSVQARGVLERVDDPDAKVACLEALMHRFQAEGRYRPIQATDPLYANVVEKLLVAKLRLEDCQGHAKLGQHKSGKIIARALDGLWARGAPGDLAAARAIREAHPEHPWGHWMRGPDGTRFEAAPDANELAAVVALLRDAYWNVGVEPDRIAAAHRESAAWLVLVDPEGRVAASARAVTDRARYAYLKDVIVAPHHRGRGWGRALIGRLLEHPALREVPCMRLWTRDAASFYGDFGFDSWTSPFIGMERRLVSAARR